MEISKTMAIQLRGLLNTTGKDLLEVGQRPHWGWKYHESKAGECLKMAKRIDKLIKKNKQVQTCLIYKSGIND